MAFERLDFAQFRRPLCLSAAPLVPLWYVFRGLPVSHVSHVHVCMLSWGRAHHAQDLGRKEGRIDEHETQRADGATVYGHTTPTRPTPSYLRDFTTTTTNRPN